MKIRLYTSLILMLVAMASPYADAKTYRWVDENGQVHYSDHIPSKEVDSAYSIMNKQGVTVDNVGKAKTKEELEKEARLKEQQKERERIARQQATRDHILLDTYATVSDLENTRDRYIATLEGYIQVSQHKLSNLNRDIKKFQDSAAKFEQKGKPVPEELSKDIANLQSQIDAENSFIAKQRTQQKDVRKKFAADIKRFEELKGLQQGGKK